MIRLFGPFPHDFIIFLSSFSDDVNTTIRLASAATLTIIWHGVSVSQFYEAGDIPALFGLREWDIADVAPLVCQYEVKSMGIIRFCHARDSGIVKDGVARAPPRLSARQRRRHRHAQVS